MDGLKIREKAYFLMDDLGGKPLFLETPIYMSLSLMSCKNSHKIRVST